MLKFAAPTIISFHHRNIFMTVITITTLVAFLFKSSESTSLINQSKVDWFCGINDSYSRIKRYAIHGTRLAGNKLTYRIYNYPKQPSIADVDREIWRAFKVWSDVADLYFSQERLSNNVDLKIIFTTGAHGDSEPFDGATLAHAFFPPRSEIHFDWSQNWTFKSYQGTNLFQVAVHEIGHALGLAHSSIPSAIMSPHYFSYDPSFRLDPDDISGIQALYGRRTVRTFAALRVQSNLIRPIACNPRKVDAVLTSPDGSIFVFKGDNYWKLEGNSLAAGYPRPISRDWPGLTGPIDAAITWNKKLIYIFKGSQYWRYDRKMALLTGRSHSLQQGFPGIPNDLDTVLAWNNKIYFFKGRLYWRFDPWANPPIKPSDYPKLIADYWSPLPDNLDAAFHHPNGHLYFFKDNQFWKSEKNSIKIDASSNPRRVKQWWNFGC